MGYLEENITDFSQLNITDLLEERVASSGENIALIYNNYSVTYNELDARSGKIANLLIKKGVKPNELVPICLNKGVELIIGIIAIQKVGAAYVPVDPEFPQERINYILKDCAATILLADSSSSTIFDSNLSCEIIEIDIILSQSDNLSAQNPTVKIAPTDLAYVIYTSGTTGLPNGVMIEHRSVVNNLLWAQGYFNLTTDDVVLQKTTFCFDVSVWEIFGTLISGAKLVIIDPDDYRDLSKLKQVIISNNITTVHFIPTMLEFFLLSIKKNECNTLKRIICSGEVLTPYQANLARNKIKGALLFNLYGPTETTIHSSYWQIPDQTDEIEKVLIGKPIDNTNFYILNNGELCGNEQIGEIYISGAGVAKGYLNRPELTESRFVKNPFDNSERLFKTGDFGRYLIDGNIEYLGRIDDQVKINGYRIELASIETNIKNSGIVKHAVVLTKKNNLGFLHIMAYVVIEHGYNIQDLWDYIVTKLPGYMLPTSIKEVEYIPFTTNGKVDKDLLRNLLSHDEASNGIVKPRTLSEKTIYNIWQKLFNTDEISIYDNFFDLGGNSIMGVKMLSRLKRETDKHISYIQLNQYPNIESLAKVLDKPLLINIPNILIAIKPEGSKPPLYLVNGGALVYNGFFNLSDVLDKDQPVYGFQSNGYNNNGQLFETIEEIAGYYVNSMLRENINGPFSLVGYSLGSIIAFEMAKQLKALGKEVKLLVTLDGLTIDPAIIKTKHTPFSILRVIGYSLFQLKYGPLEFSKYLRGLSSGISRTVKSLFVKKDDYIQEHVKKNVETNSNIDFDVFNLHIAAYLKYKITNYDGNMVVLRAKKKTFYMDDFVYLGWKPFVKLIKSMPVSGTHYTIYDDANVEELAGKLQTLLNEGF